MRDYYTDFLQNKISVDTLPSEVSKVSKGQKRGSKQPFDTFDTALPSTHQKKHAPKNNDNLAELKTDYFHAELNRFIEKGCAFDVSADGFTCTDSNHFLKISDMEFLKINKAVVLCYLQQSALMKHLFSIAPEQFEDFAFEILEREAIFSEDCLNPQLRITVKTPFEIYFETVKDVTRKWFTDLLEKMPNP